MQCHTDFSCRKLTKPFIHIINRMKKNCKISQKTYLNSYLEIIYYFVKFNNTNK